MTQSNGQTETVRGLVEQANPKGIKVDGRWFNFSQYSGDVTRPDVGDEIEMEVAKGKFIDSLSVVGGQEMGGNDFGDDFAGFDATPAPPAASRATPRSTTPVASRVTAPSGESRNAEIRRLALVKAAADYAARRSDLTPEDVMAIAAQWEGWVTRSD